MGYRDLAYAIVTQAVKDYKENKSEGKSVARLKKFFNSKWCDELLTGCPIKGKDILDQLEKDGV